MNKQDRIVLAHLTERVTPDLQDDMKAPTDFQIKALLIKMTAAEMKRIMDSPLRDKLVANSNAALQRLALAARAERAKRK